MENKINKAQGYIKSVNPFILFGIIIILFFISAMIAANGFDLLVKTATDKWVSTSTAYWISVALVSLSIAAAINRFYLLLVIRPSDIIGFIRSSLPVLFFTITWYISSGALYDIYDMLGSPTNVQMTFYVLSKLISGFINIFIFIAVCATLSSSITNLFNRR